MNSAYSFNGTSDYIKTSLIQTPGAGNTNQFTICAWVKGTTNQSIVRQQAGSNYIVLDWAPASPRDILSWGGGTTGLASGIPSDNQWHHACMEWQQNTTNGFKTFADGSLVAERISANTPIPNINSPFYIGSLDGSAEFDNGSIDNIRIYNRALNPAEVQALYNQSD
ncbi:MAG: LamG domain-containing protein [Candidatus Saccharimonadales bacterium]